MPIVISMALVAAYGSHSCSGKSSMSKLDLAVTDYGPARGAAGLWASPDGRFLAAELIFVGEPRMSPVIKVIERSTGEVVARARGNVVAGPDNSGEVAYVTAEDLTHPVLRSTARPDLAIPLGPAGGDYARWRGYRLGASRDRVVVLHEEGKSLTLELVSLAPKVPPSVLASRTLSNREIFRFAAAASPTDDVLFLSGETPGSAPEEAKGHVIAIDGNTLKERWRTPWTPGHGFLDRLAVGVTGDGAIVAAYAPSGLMLVDARSGGGASMVKFQGYDGVKLIGVPGRRALVALRVFDRPVHSSEYNIEVIELPAGAVTKLRPDTGPSNLPSIAVFGSTVLVAPGTAPRWANDPASWGPEVRGFVQQP
ncbi:MAG: hypothetical protein MJE77_41955 [Proteobacteria bacterium]|nr:hypothetical protein [Pseudomonadota bacterium]